LLRFEIDFVDIDLNLVAFSCQVLGVFWEKFSQSVAIPQHIWKLLKTASQLIQGWKRSLNLPARVNFVMKTYTNRVTNRIFVDVGYVHFGIFRRHSIVSALRIMINSGLASLLTRFCLLSRRSLKNHGKKDI
jgi:hypothetical protein